MKNRIASTLARLLVSLVAAIRPFVGRMTAISSPEGALPARTVVLALIVGASLTILSPTSSAGQQLPPGVLGCPDCTTSYSCEYGNRHGVDQCWIRAGSKCQSWGLCIYVGPNENQQDSQVAAALASLGLGAEQPHMVETPDWGTLAVTRVHDGTWVAWSCKEVTLARYLEEADGTLARQAENNRQDRAYDIAALLNRHQRTAADEAG